MAQAAPQDKEILGYYRKRSEDTNLCCHLYLSAGHYRYERYETGKKHIRSLADIKHFAYRQNALERPLRQN